MQGHAHIWGADCPGEQTHCAWHVSPSAMTPVQTPSTTLGQLSTTWEQSWAQGQELNFSISRCDPKVNNQKLNTFFINFSHITLKSWPDKCGRSPYKNLIKVLRSLLSRGDAPLLPQSNIWRVTPGCEQSCLLFIIGNSFQCKGQSMQCCLCPRVWGPPRPHIGVAGGGEGSLAPPTKTWGLPGICLIYMVLGIRHESQEHAKRVPISIISSVLPQPLCYFLGPGHIGFGLFLFKSFYFKDFF